MSESTQLNHTGVRVREAPTQIQTYYEEVTFCDPVVKLDQNSPCNLPLLFHCSDAMLQVPYILAFLQISWTKKRVAAIFS